MLYDEMRRWLHSAPEEKALNTRQQGNLFRKFLSKYPESNLLYSKMIFTTIQVNQIRGDKYKKKAAKEELWKGQCHCVYWHGNFDGIYANHLRKSVYNSLIEAEKITRNDGVFLPSIISEDFDTDGKTEFLYQGIELNAYIHTRGGSLFELDWIETGWNFLDTLSRYSEPYHHEKAREEGYDWYLRKAFLDHFYDHQTSCERFRTMSYEEQGDFLTGIYTVIDVDKEKFILSLEKEGRVNTCEGLRNVTVSKIYTFGLKSIEVKYLITNNDSQSLVTRFGIENNFSFGCGEALEGSVLRILNKAHDLITTPIEKQGVQRFYVQDFKNDCDIELDFSWPGNFWCFPLITWSRTLMVQSPIYQGNCFVHTWDLNLEPGHEWGVVVRLSIR